MCYLLGCLYPPGRHQYKRILRPRLIKDILLKNFVTPYAQFVYLRLTSAVRMKTVDRLFKDKAFKLNKPTQYSHNSYPFEEMHCVSKNQQF